MKYKQILKRLSVGASVLFFLLAIQGFFGTAWSDDGRTGKDFSDLLHDARLSLSEFEFTRVKGCGTEKGINLVHTLFKTRAEFGLGDTTDPDKPRQWSSVSGVPTTINLRWTRFSDQASAGKIFVEAVILNTCEGKQAGDLKEAYIRFSIPVFGSSGNFRAGPPKEVKVETVCCGSFRRHNYVYNMSGFPLKVAGTDNPPSPPPATPKPSPRTGSNVSSGSGRAAPPTQTGAVSGAVGSIGSKAVATVTPKPDPFTMEKVCDPCEDRKTYVDHLKRRLGNFQTEKVQKEKDLKNIRDRQAQLSQELEALKNELKAQKDVGGESTDPATGITTKSYDDGTGTVVVTRHYPDGRVEDVDKYPRRSTRQAQQDIDEKKAEKARLDKEALPLKNRLQQLDTGIKETDERLQKALADLAACVDLCNRNIGYQTNYREQYPEPAVAVSTETAAEGKEAAAGTVTATDEAQQTGKARSKPKYRSNLDLNWRLDVGIRYDVGWNYNSELSASQPVRDIFAESRLKAKWINKMPPSNILLADGLWNKNSLFVKPYSRILFDKQLFQDEIPASNANRIASRSGSMGEPKYNLGDPIATGAFNLLDDFASNLEVGAFIGSALRAWSAMFGFDLSSQKTNFGQVADYTLDILDDYEWDFDEPIFSRRDVGNAVYAAIIAAGGSPEEAYRQAKKASDQWGHPLSGIKIDLSQWRLNDSAFPRDQKLKVSPAISGFAIDPDSFSGFRSRFNPPWTLGAVFSEALRLLKSYKKVLPNDPLYKKSEGLFKKIGKLLTFGSGSKNEKAQDQWGLHAVGFTPKGTGQSAWDVYDGMEKNIVVAVIDSGLDLKHPDRPRYIWKNKGEIADNGLDDDGNGYVDDIHGWNFVSENNNIIDNYGHGTFVTGIIAANTDNGKGIAGVNSGAQIMVLKASNGEGEAQDLAIYRALRYAVDNGARVINISLGNRGQSRLVQIGLNYAHAMGRIVVVAAGNEGKNIADYTPQGSRRVISIGATNLDGSVRGKSNKGLSLAMVAPGQSIYSLTAKNSKYDGKLISFGGGNYHLWNGTSFSAPFVTGAASLVWARNPKLTNTQVEDILLSSAAEIGEPGWDPETGLGQLSAQSAMVQSPKTAFAPRITEVYVNQIRKQVKSVDIYGIIRGPVQSYNLEVGRGEKPDDDEWQRVFGPSKQTVNLGHIARIPGTFFSKGSQWTIRLTAQSTKGEIRMQQLLVNKKK